MGSQRTGGTLSTSQRGRAASAYRRDKTGEKAPTTKSAQTTKAVKAFRGASGKVKEKAKGDTTRTSSKE
jgi:hypothetical protein